MDEKPVAVTENVVVSLAYVLTVDGEVVDTADNHKPIQYIQGKNQIIPALERELEGMALGESKVIFVSADEGYGDYDPEMIAHVTREQFPPDFVFVLGGQLNIQDTSGRTFNATVRGIGPEKVELDLNHPLAGKDLVFQAMVVDLRHATEDELDNGRIIS
ncbi:MAG TPA: FKBP-type peptidyl-prolyl cis-trans isomerase [Anaerolineales bacterium]|nr:FKBP-type peptidyl-prolyl cis-trans isomerase [Anaerolineales bacterium]